MAVDDHDFRSQAKGVATPYGIYDMLANRGSVFIGISYDTAEFAVDCLAMWYALEGCLRYPNTREVILLADSGGSNGRTRRTWKYWLQKKFCNVFGLKVSSYLNIAEYEKGQKITDVPGGFQSVHLRHLDIHEHHNISG